MVLVVVLLVVFVVFSGAGSKGELLRLYKCGAYIRSTGTVAPTRRTAPLLLDKHNCLCKPEIHI